MEAEINGDDAAILKMDHEEEDYNNKYGAYGRNQTVQHGFKTQQKSKDALIRIQSKVNQTIDLAT